MSKTSAILHIASAHIEKTIAPLVPCDLAKKILLQFTMIHTIIMIENKSAVIKSLELVIVLLFSFF